MRNEGGDDWVECCAEIAEPFLEARLPVVTSLSFKFAGVLETSRLFPIRRVLWHARSEARWIIIANQAVNASFIYRQGRGVKDEMGKKFPRSLAQFSATSFGYFTYSRPVELPVSSRPSCSNNSR